MALPEAGARMTDDFAPFFPISLQALEAGFRLPLSEVGVELCCQMRVAPGQLHPNTWRLIVAFIARCQELGRDRSEEHTSELQSPLIISYAVFCLKKKFF